MDKEKELRSTSDELNRWLKQEQNTISQLRFELTAKDDTINRMGQDTDQLVQQFIQKKEQFKTQLKTQKAKMIEQVTEIEKLNRAEMD